MVTPVSEVELNAYVDGETFPERQAIIEGWLARHPADAARVETWRRQNQILGAAFCRILSEPVPATIPPCGSAKLGQSGRIAALVQPASDEENAPIRLNAAVRDRRAGLILAIASAFVSGIAVACLAALFTGLVPATMSGPRIFSSRALETQLVTDATGSLARRGIEAYGTYALEVDQTAPFDPAKPAALALWMLHHLGQSLPVTNLIEGGRFLGAHVTPGDFGAAIFLVYEREAGQRVGLLLARGTSSDTQPSYVEMRGVGASVWMNKGLAIAIAGPASHGRLMRLASAVQVHLDAH